jgi:uncharacterized surface protein with fasciclin (FAS1) repeats
MESIFSLAKTIADGVRRDIRVRWGLGAGASVLLSAGVLGLGGSFTPEFLHASTSGQRSIIPVERTEARGLEVVDMSTSTVFQVIESLPKAERFELMLYNSGADQALKRRGTYTVFVPSSADFDYLPKRYIASLSRADAGRLALGHITTQALPIEESLNGDVITLGDTLVKFEVDASAGTITVGDAKVLKAYKASNGYVYIINKVLVSTGN